MHYETKRLPVELDDDQVGLLSSLHRGTKTALCTLGLAAVCYVGGQAYDRLQAAKNARTIDAYLSSQKQSVGLHHPAPVAEFHYSQLLSKSNATMQKSAGSLRTTYAPKDFSSRVMIHGQRVLIDYAPLGDIDVLEETDATGVASVRPFAELGAYEQHKISGDYASLLKQGVRSLK